MCDGIGNSMFDQLLHIDSVYNLNRVKNTSAGYHHYHHHRLLSVFHATHRLDVSPNEAPPTRSLNL